MNNSLEIKVVAERDELIPNKVNVKILFPESQSMSVQQATHLLISGVSLLIKSCGKTDNGIKDYELLDEVVEHLNHEFFSLKSFDDAVINKEKLNDNSTSSTDK